jgi:prepilin-type N-terminal cleavage/methylation domain-containing protein
MNKNIFNKKTSGFTLIELLVVISIISLISSIVLSSLADARDDARVAKVQQDFQQIRNAFELYVSSNNQNLGGYNDNCSIVPSGSDGDIGQININNDYDSDLELYLPEIPNDPWGNSYYLDTYYNCDPSNLGSNSFSRGCEGQSQGVYINAFVSGGPDGLTLHDSGGNSYDDIVMLLCDYSN